MRKRRRGPFHLLRTVIVLAVIAALLSVPTLRSAESTVSNTSTVQQPPPDPSVRVWVNTRSGVYHCPGTRYYEATKRGRHLSERAAQDSGYRPSHGRTCG